MVSSAVRKSRYYNKRMEQQKRREYIMRIGKVAAAIGAAAIVCLFFRFLRQNSVPNEPVAAMAASEESVSITVKGIGSSTLQEADETNLQNLSSALTKGDIAVTNLTSVVTEEDDFEGQKKNAVKVNPDRVDLLRDSGINVVNLANSHSKDCGENGYLDTVQNLTKAGITSFGYDRITVKEVRGIRIAFTGIDASDNGTDHAAVLKKNIQAGKQMGAKLVIVSIDWGADDTDRPNAEQRELGHAAIDQGADLVLGYHADTVQETEEYKGKYITYSLGGIQGEGVFEQTFTFQKGELEDGSEAKIHTISADQS